VEQELKCRSRDPPNGIGIWPSGNRFDLLDAVIDGREDSPFLGGEFRLLATIPPNTDCEVREENLPSEYRLGWADLPPFAEA
jgi:hypothetical protein